MSEFLIGLTVLMPLFLAISYAGKYSDIQQTATQASRYAAMQRLMEPSESRLTPATIADQTRARFFIDTKLVHDGRLQSDDTAVGIVKADKQLALWRDQSFGALLPSLDQVDIQWSKPAVTKDLILPTAGKLIRKSYDPATLATVEVTLVNKMDQTVAKPDPLKLAAATATMGNDWSSSGHDNLVSTLKPFVPSTVLKPFQPVFDIFTLFFEGSGHRFQLGCIKPEVVPTDRLGGTPDNKACH